MSEKQFYGANCFHFGPFEADRRSGELRKHGLKVKLQDQPFQVLVALLENRGEVVTREELRGRLWPADTFVDFDHSMNTAVNKLRSALDDSPDHPRYIETLPRRGYRFVGPPDAPSEEDLRDTHSQATTTKQGTPRVFVKRLQQEALAAGGFVFLLLLPELGRDGSPQTARSFSDIPRIESLAVVPLESLSSDPEQVRLANAVTNDLISHLERIPTLRLLPNFSDAMQRRSQATAGHRSRVERRRHRRGHGATPRKSRAHFRATAARAERPAPADGRI